VTPDDEAEISKALRAAIRSARGYADFFGWGPNRDLEELTVLTSLGESLEKDRGAFFRKAKVRGRGNHHPTKRGTVTVSGKPSVEVPPGTLNSALRQAGLKK
jgi:hypothetical protein